MFGVPVWLLALVGIGAVATVRKPKLPPFQFQGLGAPPKGSTLPAPDGSTAGSGPTSYIDEQGRRRYKIPEGMEARHSGGWQTREIGARGDMVSDFLTFDRRQVGEGAKNIFAFDTINLTGTPAASTETDEEGLQVPIEAGGEEAVVDAPYRDQFAGMKFNTILIAIDNLDRKFQWILDPLRADEWQNIDAIRHIKHNMELAYRERGDGGSYHNDLYSRRNLLKMFAGLAFVGDNEFSENAAFDKYQSKGKIWDYQTGQLSDEFATYLGLYSIGEEELSEVINGITSAQARPTPDFWDNLKGFVIALFTGVSDLTTTVMTGNVPAIMDGVLSTVGDLFNTFGSGYSMTTGEATVKPLTPEEKALLYWMDGIMVSVPTMAHDGQVTQRTQLEDEYAPASAHLETLTRALDGTTRLNHILSVVGGVNSLDAAIAAASITWDDSHPRANRPVLSEKTLELYAYPGALTLKALMLARRAGIPRSYTMFFVPRSTGSPLYPGIMDVPGIDHGWSRKRGVTYYGVHMASLSRISGGVSAPTMKWFMAAIRAQFGGTTKGGGISAWGMDPNYLFAPSYNIKVRGGLYGFVSDDGAEWSNPSKEAKRAPKYYVDYRPFTPSGRAALRNANK